MSSCFTLCSGNRDKNEKIGPEPLTLMNPSSNQSNVKAIGPPSFIEKSHSIQGAVDLAILQPERITSTEVQDRNGFESNVESFDVLAGLIDKQQAAERNIKAKQIIQLKSELKAQKMKNTMLRIILHWKKIV